VKVTRYMESLKDPGQAAALKAFDQGLARDPVVERRVPPRWFVAERARRR
jgi:hypothetical protein